MTGDDVVDVLLALLVGGLATLGRAVWHLADRVARLEGRLDERDRTS